MGFLQAISQVVLGVSILFLLLLAFSFAVVEPGTDSAAIEREND
ncbi:hypothetical protein [Halostagnicola sp. A56]|nr:hypothetical protein [Halostagnicola sp. A56]